MKYQPLKKITLFLGLIIVCQHTIFSQSKKWSIGVGNAITAFDFTNSIGNKIDYLKNGAGNAYIMGYEQSLLDTNKFVGQSTPKAIYYLKHQQLAKFLTRIKLGVHAIFNQYNAVGNIQNFDFDYQTNYAGLQFSLGPSIAMGKNWIIQPNAVISAQHILQGNQRVNSSYIDLTNDSSFKGIKTFVGYEISIEKQINNSLSFYLKGSNTQTMQTKEGGIANLNFKSNCLQIGIKITGN